MASTLDVGECRNNDESINQYRTLELSHNQSAVQSNQPLLPWSQSNLLLQLKYKCSPWWPWLAWLTWGAVIYSCLAFSRLVTSILYVCPYGYRWTYCSCPIVAYIICTILWTPLLTLMVIMNTMWPPRYKYPLCTSSTPSLLSLNTHTCLIHLHYH